MAVHDVIATAADHLEDVLVGIVESAQGVPRLAGPDERGRQTRRVDPRLDDVCSRDPRTRRRIDIDVVPAVGQPDRQVGDHHLRSALLRLRDGRHQRCDDGDPQWPGRLFRRNRHHALKRSVAVASVPVGYVFVVLGLVVRIGFGLLVRRRFRFRQLSLAFGLHVSLLGLAQRLVRVR